MTLGEILSLDLVVDDHKRRKLVLDAVPKSKVDELEERTHATIDRLREACSLAPAVRRALAESFSGCDERGECGQLDIGTKSCAPFPFFRTLTVVLDSECVNMPLAIYSKSHSRRE